MATYLQNLYTRRDNVAAELAAIVSTSAGGKPNSATSGIDHQGYVAGLNGQLEKLQALIEKEEMNSGGANSTVFDITVIAET